MARLLQVLLTIILAGPLRLFVAEVAADPRFDERVPLGHFEPTYHAAFTSTSADRELDEEIITCSSAIDPPASPIDLRVSKAHASHGYDAVRISVVTYSADAPAFVRVRKLEDKDDNEEEISWTYSAPLRYRWTAQFDTGVHNTRCVDPDHKISTSEYKWGGHAESPAADSQCLFDCQSHEDCQYFSFYYNHTTSACICELFQSCAKCVGGAGMQQENVQRNDGDTLLQVEDHPVRGWTTTKKYGKSYIHTVIVNVTPGISNPFIVAGTPFDIKIPQDGHPAKCIVWGDPCISSKFVGCSFGKYFDSYEKSVTMINALAEADPDDGGFDCFIMLGDNFYDSDGTITTSFWKRLSTKAMSKPLVYILGNHDIWTGGAPDDGVIYDPLQYSMQYFGIDTVLSKSNASQYFDYSINPDNPPVGSGTKYQSITATSSIDNSIGWYKFGGFGVLFFNGAYTSNDILPYFQEACEFFENNVSEDETILLLGHWNGNETIQSWILPYGGQLVTPRARELLLDLPGCSHRGSKIIYFDGHGHTNQMVPGDNGYLAGGHGIMGLSPSNFSVPVAADYGFMFTKSTPTKVYYCQEIYAPTSSLPPTTADFDPSTIDYEKYNAILECVTAAGIDKCAHLCDSWVYFGESSVNSTGPFDGKGNPSITSGFVTRPCSSFGNILALMIFVVCLF